MKIDEKEKKSYLQRIAHILMLNGGFLDNPGLFSGEMGIVLFFARYARFTQNDLYADYFYDLIEKIQSRINQETPINYELGLTGIGSAFEYLVQNTFVEADTDDILGEFDKRVFMINNLPFLPIEDIQGIGYYALWRTMGINVSNTTIKDTIKKVFLPQIMTFLAEKIENPLDILSIRKNPQILDLKAYTYLLDQLSKKDIIDKNRKNPGIQNGFAGLGLTFLTEIDGDDSWTSLFPEHFLSDNIKSQTE